MPLVRIELLEGKPEAYRQKLSDAVHQALVETMDVLDHDRFQIITEHPTSAFVYTRQYGSTPRTNALVILQITLNAGRTTAMKNSFYKKVVELLEQEIGMRKEDIFISLVEVNNENWFVL